MKKDFYNLLAGRPKLPTTMTRCHRTLVASETDFQEIFHFTSAGTLVASLSAERDVEPWGTRTPPFKSKSSAFVETPMACTANSPKTDQRVTFVMLLVRMGEFAAGTFTTLFTIRQWDPPTLTDP